MTSETMSSRSTSSPPNISRSDLSTLPSLCKNIDSAANLFVGRQNSLVFPNADSEGPERNSDECVNCKRQWAKSDDGKIYRL